MNSPHTFFGKVSTLLVGGLLSWLTVTKPEFRESVGDLLGQPTAMAQAGQSQPIAELPLLKQSSDGEAAAQFVAASPDQRAGFEQAPAETIKEPTAHPQQEDPSQVQQLAARLRQLGASYLLLERLPHAEGDKFRARCDVAGEASQVKCCFEATRRTAVDALSEVLDAVLRMDEDSAPTRLDSSI